MIPRSLRIRRTGPTGQTSVAWLISGPADRWLREIARWEVDESRCEIYVLPRSRTDLSAMGALIFTDGQEPAVTPAGIAFSLAGPRIFAPADAELLPRATKAELMSLSRFRALILHPAIGIIGSDTPLRVADLIDVPEERDTQWLTPRGRRPDPLPALASIRLAHSISMEEIFGGAEGEIGNEPPTNLPPTDLEKKNGPMGKMGRAFQMGGLRFAQWMLGSSEDRRPPEWVQRALNGIADKMGAMQRDLERLRNGALDRLFEQLDKDPDEGLRHALPLSSPSFHRGFAPPSANLGSHDINFSLGSLGGGRPLDGWNLAENMRRRLREKYLELADRECRLGRFRRAAYIHAELLGDLHAAALALRQGGHWQEAAIVYRDHLKQPLEAAYCFVEARDFQDAIAIYVERKEFEQLADLYGRLGDRERAADAVQQWIHLLMSKGDMIKAAELLEKRAFDRPAALRLLENSWPASPQARLCFLRLFQMRAEAGEHMEARAFLEKVAGSPTPNAFATSLLEVLGVLQTTYPDRETIALAEDLGRCQAASLLSTTSTEHHRNIVRLLGSLAPSDRLVARDGMRFLTRYDQAPKTVPLITPPKAEPGVTQITKQADFKLPFRGIDWEIAVCDDQNIYVAGYSEDTTRKGFQVAAARVSYDSATQCVHWNKPATADREGRILLTPFYEPWEGALIHLAPSGPLSLQDVPAGNFPRAARFGTPSWFADPVYAVTSQGSDIWAVRYGGDGPVLTRYSASGGIQQNASISQEELINFEAVAQLPIVLAECGGYVVFAWGKGAFVYHHRNIYQHQAVTFDERVISVVTPSRWAKPHFAIVSETSVKILWPDRSDNLCDHVLGQLDSPVAGFTGDNTLVIIAGARGYLVDSDHRGKPRMARFDWNPIVRPIAILRGPSAFTFATVTREGDVGVHRFSLNDLR